MNIINFTPISALLGGFLIGLSVALFFILNGRMVGISGIASNLLVSKNQIPKHDFYVSDYTEMFQEKTKLFFPAGIILEEQNIFS